MIGMILAVLCMGYDFPLIGRPFAVSPRPSAEVGNPMAKEIDNPLQFWTSGFV